MPHLVSLVHALGVQGVGFQSLMEVINTTTAGGKLVFHIMGALAEFERTLIAERSQAGTQAARRRGTHLGRPHKLTREQVAHAARMVRDGTETVSDMVALYGADHVPLPLRAVGLPSLCRWHRAGLLAARRACHGRPGSDHAV